MVHQRALAVQLTIVLLASATGLDAYQQGRASMGPGGELIPFMGLQGVRLEIRGLEAAIYNGPPGTDPETVGTGLRRALALPYAGSGREAGLVDAAPARARFYEPGGLSSTSDALFVADTNNHAIRRIRLSDGRVETIDVRENDRSGTIAWSQGLGTRDSCGASASEESGAVAVAATATSPGHGCLTPQALSSPVDVARLPKRDGPVRFDITRVTVDCQ